MHELRTVVLCGGQGTRAWPLSARVPKPLLPVGDRPVLRHLLDVYARQGFTDFVLAAGHLAHRVVEFAATLPADWRVEVVDTGAEAGTAERLARVRSRLGPRFLATYGDGLGDVDLPALLRRHDEHGGLATVTAVPLRSQYGTLELAGDDRVRGFREKPVIDGMWMNAGFFVFEADALAAPAGPDLERDVLPVLADRGELHVHRHRGFWGSVDTAKDLAVLSGLAAQDPPPWHSGSAKPALDGPAESEQVPA